MEAIRIVHAFKHMYLHIYLSKENNVTYNKLENRRLHGVFNLCIMFIAWNLEILITDHLPPTMGSTIENTHKDMSWQVMSPCHAYSNPHCLFSWTYLIVCLWACHCAPSPVVFKPIGWLFSCKPNHTLKFCSIVFIMLSLYTIQQLKISLLNSDNRKCIHRNFKYNCIFCFSP